MIPRSSLVVAAAIAQLAAWLLLRPDTAGPQWSDGGRVGAWIAAESAAAAAVGLVAKDRRTVVLAVLATACWSARRRGRTQRQA